EPAIFFLLLSDVLAHLALVPPYCRYVISTRPEVQPDKVLGPIHKPSGDRYRTSPFDVSHHSGYRILRRDRQHHVHMMLSIPPKYSVSGVVGYIKGRSAIAIARRFMDRTKNFVGLNFWARGYYVSTVGRDESQVRQYIREQEKEDRRLDQLKRFE